MNDLGDYLAKRTCQHIKDVSSRAGSRFAGGLFECKGSSPTRFSVWGDYEIYFKDNGSSIQFVLDSNGHSFSSLSGKLANLEVPLKYRKVFSNIHVKFSSEDFIILELDSVPMQNTAGRTQNKNKLFYAVYNTVVKPSLRAVFDFRGM